jgi:hypothetical protein
MRSHGLPAGELAEHGGKEPLDAGSDPLAFDSRLPATFSTLNPPVAIHAATSDGRTPRPGPPRMAAWSTPV